MRRHALVVDLTLAVVLAAVVLILSPGVAIVAILALLVLAVCGASVAVDAGRGRRAPRPGRGRRAPRPRRRPR